MKHGIATLALLLVSGLAPGLATPDPTAAQEGGGQSAVELVVASEIENREPVGAGDTFPADVGQVHAWMHLTGYDGQAIQVVWTHGDHTSTVPLEVGGSPWRTWSSKTIPSDWTGPWSVTVEDIDGNVLARADFTVGSAVPRAAAAR